MARLFTAIELTDSVRAAVAHVQHDLASAVTGVQAPRLRLVRPPELHLTLVFVGEVNDDRVGAIRAAITEGFELNPFTLTFSGAGTFPPLGRARVLWLGVKDDSGSLAQLFHQVAHRLAGAGVPVGTGRFTPHLTLGRWREDGPRVVTLPTIGAVATQLVSEVGLVHSQLRPDGPLHTVVARGRLSPAAARLH